MVRLFTALGALLVLSACSEAPEQTATQESDAVADALALIKQENLYAHLAYLASDELSGREAGQPGYDLAAKYVAEQYAEIGLEPGGSEGWYQPVELQSYGLDASGAELIVHRDGQDVVLENREDYVMVGDRVRPEMSVRGEVVYVGYGAHAPELGYSDLDGVDLDGKIVAYFSGGPQSIKGDKLAHYASYRNKAKEWAKRGAVGALFLRSRQSEKFSDWDRFKKTYATSPSQTWVNASGEAAYFVPGIRGWASISPALADVLLSGTPMSFEDARDKIEASEVASMPLGVEVSIKTRSIHERFTSPNVVGLLKGTDPELADEYIVFSAHLDHEGITAAPIDGDAVLNGMYDNAMGTAIMIEAARALAANPPRRSILFVALTAEEKGLLGSDYFARYPTVPSGSLIANVNMDMPLFLFPLNEMVAFGAEHSSLGDVAAAAASAEGFTLVPDQMPEEILFSRSDQFSFVKQGITAIWLSPGIKSSDPSIDGPAVVREHRSVHYHKPSDDLSRPIEWEPLLGFTRANARIGWSIANNDARPTWNDDSFYGNLYAPQKE